MWINSYDVRKKELIHQGFTYCCNKSSLNPQLASTMEMFLVSLTSQCQPFCLNGSPPYSDLETLLTLYWGSVFLNTLPRITFSLFCLVWKENIGILCGWSLLHATSFLLTLLLLELPKCRSVCVCDCILSPRDIESWVLWSENRLRHVGQLMGKLIYPSGQVMGLG